MPLLSQRSGEIRCERRGCSKWFVPHHRSPKTGATKQRFCSESCQCLERAYRNGYKARKKFGVCRNNHERTPENTRHRLSTLTGRPTPVCMVCRDLQAKRRTAAARARRLAA